MAYFHVSIQNIYITRCSIYKTLQFSNEHFHYNKEGTVEYYKPITASTFGVACRCSSTSNISDNDTNLKVERIIC